MQVALNSVSPVRFQGGQNQPKARFESGGNHFFQLGHALGLNDTQAAYRPFIRTLNATEYRALKEKNAYRNFPDVDFDKQAVVVTYPAQQTPSGSIALELKGLSFNPQDGLTVKLDFTRPGIGTMDIGSPWHLLVVDKQWTEKGLKFDLFRLDQ